ncbi:MAG: two-component regulator propeller domain-containing protein, partial [Flavobacteriaceae bacterium]
FIWISTQNGLNRYDGHSFKVYQKRNSKISSNDISDIILDSKNRIWLSTLDGSLNLYNRDLDDFTVYNNYSKKSNSSSSNHINTILEDKNGTIWLATELGLINFNPENKTFKNYEDSILENINITSLYQSDNGNLWIGSFGKGLFLIDRYTQEIKKIDLQNDHLIQFINVFEELNSDNLLIGTKGNGLFLFDLQTKKIKSYFKQNNSIAKKNTAIIRSLKIDSNSNLWIGTDGFGLYKIKFPNSDEPIIKNYMYNPQLQSSLSGNAVYEITEIDKSSIWVGTAWNGINIIDLENISEFLHSDFSGLNPFPVLSVHKTKDLLFFGTDGNGLSIYDLKNKKPYSIPKIKEAKYVQHISSNNNNLWLGTFSNGLINYNLKTKQYKQFVKSIENEKSLSFNDVRDLIFDKSNNIWIATWGGGLNYFDTKNEEFLSYQFKENDATSLSNNNIVSLEKDDNKIWIATYGGGLNMFDIKSKSFKRFNFAENNSETISSNFLFSLFKGSNNYLWIGTSGSGICRMNLNDYSIERFNAYKYSTITSIKEDDNKNIWFGTKKGILKFDYKTRKIERAQSLSGDFHINSSFKDNNNLYFGGIKGVKKFNPNQLHFSSKKIDVIITDLKLFNKKVPITKNGILKKNIQFQKDITLKHSDNVFTFEYAGLNYPFSENLEYAIQLENFDKDWRKVGQDRTATFTNLSPGNYIFKVKSRVAGTVWNTNFTAINIKILKPFWTTWWAIVMYFLLLLTLLLITRKYVIAWGKLKSSLEFEKLMHEKDNEIYTLKQQFFTNISHEIRTPVTLIISSINRLFEKEKLKESKQIKAAHTIRRNSNLLLRLVNELLDVRKLEKNDIQLTITEKEFISYVKGIYLSFSDIALDRNINYEFKTNISKIYLWFDKNQLEKVIFNLISNAFKFTNDKGNIQICIEEYNNEVIIFVKDDGIGLSEEHQKKIFKRFYQVKYEHSEKNKGFGLGLSIAKEIVQLHKAKIKVTSKLKEGSSFELKILKGNTHFEKINSTKKQTDSSKSIEILQEKIKDKNKTTLLIVEDNIEIQESLKELLEAKNYNIIQAFNGLEGLQLVTKNQPDLIISDLMMPKMDGIEFTNKIKSNSITNHIPVILLTAKTAIDDKTLAYNKGADDYISKPFDEELLLIRIKNLLQSRKILKNKFSKEEEINPKKINTNSKDQELLEKLYKILEENLETNNLKSDYISDQMNMSHSSMYKKIKSLTGLTYIEFIRDYRLSVAKQLIQENGYSVSEACYKVGYTDRKYFSKLFKNKFKENPSFYLKS